jgi:hypothetical protein
MMSRASFNVEVVNGDREGVLKRAADFLAKIKYEETKPDKPNSRLFRRGVGALTAPKLIELSFVIEEGKTWLKCDGFITFNLLFTFGKIAELAFTDELGYGAIPRRTGLKDLVLLQRHLGGGGVTIDPGKPINWIKMAIAFLIPIIILFVCSLCYIAISSSGFMQ